MSLILLFGLITSAGVVKRSLVDMSDTVSDTVKTVGTDFYYRPLSTAIPLAMLYYNAKKNSDTRRILAAGAALTGAAYLAGSVLKSSKKPAVSYVKVKGANHLLDSVDTDFVFRGAPDLVFPTLKVTRYRKNKYSGKKVKKTIVQTNLDKPWGVLHYMLVILTLMAIVLITILLFK